MPMDFAISSMIKASPVSQIFTPKYKTVIFAHGYFWMDIPIEYIFVVLLRYYRNSNPVTN
jgi:hypothetical protein